MSEAIDHLKEWISFPEYLEREIRMEERHEYVDGKVFAMVGATESHEIVAGNVFADIHRHLKGHPCRVFKGDMKLKIALHRRDLGYYPDIMVTCEENDTDPLFKVSPKLLIEVMSNYRTDHMEKLFAHQQIPSLQDYLVVNQDPDEPKAWLYRRSHQWEQEDGAPDGVIQLRSIDYSIPLKDLYVA